MFRKFIFFAGLLLAVSQSSQAATVFNISNAAGFFPGGQVQVKLENFENIGVDAGTPGLLDIGDTLRGIIRITTSSHGSNQYQPDGSFELTGIFETEVIGFTPVADSDGPPVTTGDLLSAVQFGPHAGFATDLATITGQPVGNFSGAMVALFEDGSPDWLTSIGSVSAAEGTATDGNLFAVLGSTGTWGTDYYWGADGPRALALNTVLTTSFAASLDLLINNTGLIFDDNITQTPTNQVGIAYGFGLGAIQNIFGLKGSVKPTQASAGDPVGIYGLRSDDPVTASTVVPEPGSMLIWAGMSMAGACAAYRRRRKVAG